MKNPSNTCLKASWRVSTYEERKKCHIDATTGKLLRKLKSVGYYDELIIYNLYPIYGANSKAVRQFYYGNNQQKGTRLLKKYNKFLRKQLSKLRNTDFVCAWGAPNGIKAKDYNEQIHFVLSCIDKTTNNFLQFDLMQNKFTPLQIMEYKKNLQPLHGLRWK